MQWRTALCQSDQGKILSNDSCPMEHKATRQSCNTDGCPRWSTSNWTHVSVCWCSANVSRKHISNSSSVLLSHLFVFFCYISKCIFILACHQLHVSISVASVLWRVAMVGGLVMFPVPRTTARSSSLDAGLPMNRSTRTSAMPVLAPGGMLENSDQSVLILHSHLCSFFFLLSFCFDIL